MYLPATIIYKANKTVIIFYRSLAKMRFLHEDTRPVKICKYADGSNEKYSYRKMNRQKYFTFAGSFFR